MYLGFLLTLLGATVAFAHPFAFAVLPGLILYMNRFQIAPKEPALSAKFGLAYVEYCQRLRRWLLSAGSLPHKKPSPSGMRAGPPVTSWRLCPQWAPQPMRNCSGLSLGDPA